MWQYRRTEEDGVLRPGGSTDRREDGVLRRGDSTDRREFKEVHVGHPS